MKTPGTLPMRAAERNREQVQTIHALHAAGLHRLRGEEQDNPAVPGRATTCSADCAEPDCHPTSATSPGPRAGQCAGHQNLGANCSEYAVASISPLSRLHGSPAQRTEMSLTELLLECRQEGASNCALSAPLQHTTRSPKQSPNATGPCQQMPKGSECFLLVQQREDGTSSPACLGKECRHLDPAASREHHHFRRDEHCTYHIHGITAMHHSTRRNWKQEAGSFRGTATSSQQQQSPWKQSLKQDLAASTQQSPDDLLSRAYGHSPAMPLAERQTARPPGVPRACDYLSGPPPLESVQGHFCASRGNTVVPACAAVRGRCANECEIHTTVRQPVRRCGSISTGPHTEVVPPSPVSHSCNADSLGGSPCSRKEAARRGKGTLCHGIELELTQRYPQAVAEPKNHGAGVGYRLLHNAPGNLAAGDEKEAVAPRKPMGMPYCHPHAGAPAHLRRRCWGVDCNGAAPAVQHECLPKAQIMPSDQQGIGLQPPSCGRSTKGGRDVTLCKARASTSPSLLVPHEGSAEDKSALRMDYPVAQAWPRDLMPLSSKESVAQPLYSCNSESSTSSSFAATSCSRQGGRLSLESRCPSSSRTSVLDASVSSGAPMPLSGRDVLNIEGSSSAAGSVKLNLSDQSRDDTPQDPTTPLGLAQTMENSKSRGCEPKIACNSPYCASAIRRESPPSTADEKFDFGLFGFQPSLPVSSIAARIIQRHWRLSREHLRHKHRVTTALAIHPKRKVALPQHCQRRSRGDWHNCCQQGEARPRPGGTGCQDIKPQETVPAPSVTAANSPRDSAGIDPMPAAQDRDVDPRKLWHSQADRLAKEATSCYEHGTEQAETSLRGSVCFSEKQNFTSESYMGNAASQDSLPAAAGHDVLNPCQCASCPVDGRVDQKRKEADEDGVDSDAQFAALLQEAEAHDRFGRGGQTHYHFVPEFVYSECKADAGNKGPSESRGDHMARSPSEKAQSHEGMLGQLKKRPQAVHLSGSQQQLPSCMYGQETLSAEYAEAPVDKTISASEPLRPFYQQTKQWRISPLPLSPSLPKVRSFNDELFNRDATSMQQVTPQQRTFYSSPTTSPSSGAGASLQSRSIPRCLHDSADKQVEADGNSRDELNKPSRAARQCAVLKPQGEHKRRG